MNRSIRRTLIFWYALILTLVIGAFGGFLYDHQRRTVIAKVDAEIESHALALAGTVEWEDDEGYDLEHAEVYARRFEDEAFRDLYFVITLTDGDRLAASRDVPKRPGDEEYLREITVSGPRDSRIVVGRRMESVNQDLDAFLSAVLAIGAATLVLSLAGGWLLVSRLLRPIERMTATAERISDSNLSERIDVGRTETELGRLASTLNGAFDRLESAFERQTRFTADASHELRTPLSVVVSNAEAGLRRDRSVEEYREALGKCLRAGHRMTGVVEGLLVLARADSGELELDREELDLGTLVTEVVEDLEPLAAKHGVGVEVHAAAASLRGDAERLRNAVGNLVANAIRYNREGGCVTITVGAEVGEAVLTVADTGMGIPEEDLENVFKRFYRVDKARSREVGGNGLGLAITRWIVNAHGGRISITSEEGVGTTATVRLPKAP